MKKKSTKKNNTEKIELHPRNKNRQQYDLKAMTGSYPALKKYIQPNKRGEDSINFSDPDAVKTLNQAILSHYYNITYWEFPDENLCPPIPGRAEYIHHVADLLSADNHQEIPTGKKITCLDIGTGASGIYPILGVTEYQWNFIASDIDPKSLISAQNIVASNPQLKGKVHCRLQKNPKLIFKGIIQPKDRVDITLCNPPFHSSIEEAQKGTKRKIKNLTGQKKSTPKLNFSGNHNELIYEGGEYLFIQRMISESKAFAKHCLWFSSLVSKESNLKKIYKALKSIKPTKVKTIPIRTGNKTSRIVAWTYFNAKERQNWFEAKKS